MPLESVEELAGWSSFWRHWNVHMEPTFWNAASRAKPTLERICSGLGWPRNDEVCFCRFSDYSGRRLNRVHDGFGLAERHSLSVRHVCASFLLAASALAAWAAEAA